MPVQPYMNFHAQASKEAAYNPGDTGNDGRFDRMRLAALGIVGVGAAITVVMTGQDILGTAMENTMRVITNLLERTE